MLQVLEQRVQTLKRNLSLYVYIPFANTTQAGMQLNACHSDCTYMKETQVSVLRRLIFYQIMVYCAYSYSFFWFLLQGCYWAWRKNVEGNFKKTQSKRWKMKWIKTCVPPIVRSRPCQNCLATVIYSLLEKPLSWWYLSPNVFRHAVCKVYGICCAINTWKTLFAVCFCFVLFSSHPNIPKRLAAVFSES